MADFAAVTSGQCESRGGPVAAGTGDERRLMARGNDLVLGQGPYLAWSTTWELDVAGGVGADAAPSPEGAAPSVPAPADADP